MPHNGIFDVTPAPETGIAFGVQGPRFRMYGFGFRVRPRAFPAVNVEFISRGFPSIDGACPFIDGSPLSINGRFDK